MFFYVFISRICYKHKGNINGQTFTYGVSNIKADYLFSKMWQGAEDNRSQNLTGSFL